MNSHEGAPICFPYASQGDSMKLDSKTVARLALPAGKSDVIVFDEFLPGFGLRLRGTGGQVRKSWIVQYRRAGRSAACCSDLPKC
jgi:hypothetical protein